MPDMTPMLLVAAVVPRTGKIIKNGPRVFERRENFNLPKSAKKGLISKRVKLH